MESMNDLVSLEAYDRERLRTEVLRREVRIAKRDHGKELRRVQAQLRAGKTTGQPAVDYALLKATLASTGKEIEELAGWVERIVHDFRGRHGQLFLLRREVPDGFIRSGDSGDLDGDGVESVTTEYICARFDADGRPGLSASCDTHGVALEVRAPMHVRFWVSARVTPIVELGPVRIRDIRKPASRDGEDCCDDAGKMAYWIGDDVVRAQLANIDVRPEDVLAALEAPPLDP